MEFVLEPAFRARADHGDEIDLCSRQNLRQIGKRLAHGGKSKILATRALRAEMPDSCHETGGKSSVFTDMVVTVTFGPPCPPSHSIWLPAFDSFYR
jgi:hypothetical protein